MVVTKIAFKSKVHIDKILKLLETLFIKPKSTDNYILAFIHRSLVNERPDFAPEHNERLEFLWDAVLELIITSNLYNDFPNKSEWELTDIRSSLVRWKNLAQIARKLWFTNYLLLWKWEELWWWRENDYLLANSLEAFLWAIYLDLGYFEAEKFVNRFIYSTLNKILEENLVKDYKSLLQEYTQLEYMITPNYKVISETWPDHNKEFISWVFLWENKIWEWKWSSKKKSQENAAKKAFLNKDKWKLKWKFKK